MRIYNFAIPLLGLSFLAGCANLAPDYARPELPVPVSLDGTTPASAPAAAPLNWQQVITDPRLKATIDLALANNRDLRIAALNIEKARAQYQIDKAPLLPAVSASLSGASSSANDVITRKTSAGLGITAYELDFFGRLNNLKDASLQSFLSTEATQRSVRTSLIAETSNAWLTLAANQQQLKLAKETYATRAKTLELARKQQALGSTSRLTLAQAEATAESSRGEVARYASLVEQSRNALNLLAGTTVSADALPMPADDLPATALALVAVPSGLSSEVLLKRPDIIAAEHTLLGSYANIGAARAAFFPSITLTASGGSASSALGSLFGAGTGVWSFVPALNLPIFNAGKLNAALAVAETTRDIEVATYEKTIQTAFREVADALAERSTLNQRLAAQEAQVAAYATALRLSTERYRSGADSFLTVLDSQRSLYTAQSSLITLKLTEQANRMTLFKTLGGE